MKTIEINKISDFDASSLSAVAASMKQHGVKTAVSTVNWKDYDYVPDVALWLAYTPDRLWCYFEVEEKHALAVNMEPNGNVWEDSCVEIFIGDPDGEHYFNFENNCAGTGLVARRLSQTDLELWSAADVQRVTRLSSLPHESINRHGDVKWQLAVGIPFAMIGHSEVPSELRANFYKCGDNTETPHFLSWSPIDTPSPSFHQPKFFGKIILK